VGAASPIHYLMPQRIYALLQAVGLVFLGAFSVLHLCRNRMAIAVVGVLAILLMFSTSSIVAGPEASPFQDNRPYWKTFETAQERACTLWTDHFIEPSFAYTSRTFMSQKILAHEVGFDVELLPLSNPGEVDFGSIHANTTLLFSMYDMTTGYPYRMGETRMGTLTFGRLNQTEVSRLFDEYDQYYDNGIVSILRT